MRTSTTPFALSLALALVLACSGAGNGDVAAEPDVADAAAATDETPSAPDAAAPSPTSADEAADPEDVAQAKAGAYSNNAYGVCRKYTDCECNLYGSVTNCVEEFGDAKDMFPPSVWS